MKTEFNVNQIFDIILKVRQFKKLYVTTEGQMFTVEADAIEAIRTKNMIIDEPEDFIGLVTLTEDMVDKANVAKIRKDLSIFDKYFEGAKIPRSREKKEEVTRKREKPSTEDKNVLDSLADELGLNDDVEPEAEPVKEPAAEPVKEPAAEPVKEPAAEPVKEPAETTVFNAKK